MRHLTIKIARGVTVFPDDDTFHVEELIPPVHLPDAELIKIHIDGNVVTHWWQHAEPKVNSTVLRAAAGAASGGTE